MRDEFTIIAHAIEFLTQIDGAGLIDDSWVGRDDWVCSAIS